MRPHLPAPLRLAPVLLFLCCLPLLHAQQPPDPFAAESIVVEHLDTVFSYQPDGTGFRQQTAVIRVQSEAALRELGVLTLPFASSSEHVDLLYARVRRPDGTVIETPVSGAQEQPNAVTREAPFYSDLKEKQLPIRSLRVGDRLEWQARIVRTRAEAPNQFWGADTFDEGSIVLSETIELHVPKGSTVNVWTKPGLPKPAESDAGAEHIYHWQHAQLTPTVGKQAEDVKKAKEKKLLTADEELDEREGRLPSLQFSTFASWQAVGEWYRALEADRTRPDPETKAKVAELTKGMSNSEDKARAVYAFVSGQVRYIGVAFGVGRYQPHAASDVLANQYGDCKDKHTLLAAMLTELGLHPDAVLIGAGIRFNAAVPSPAAFNHLITQVEIDGKPVWLDTTTEVAPWRVLLANLRDHQALIVPESGPAHIERVPRDLPFPAVDTMTSVGALDKDGIANSHLTLTFRGDDEIMLRAVIRQIAPAQYDTLVERLSSAMGYGGTTSHPEIAHLEDTSVPLSISYDYHREKGGDWDNLKIVPQLMPVSLPVLDEKTPPIRPIQLGVPLTASATAEMKIPEGWTAQLPEAIHEKTAFASYDETYRFEKGTIYAQRNVTVLQDKLPAAEWKTYKTWADKVNLGSDMFISLHKPDSASNGTSSTNQAEAARLIQNAFDNLPGNAGSAQVSLKKAQALSPQQRDLWGAYGAYYYTKRDFPEAIRNYRKELALHPDAYWVYAPMARAQTATGHNDEAVESLRTWAHVEPTNTAPTVSLVDMLLTVGDAEGAVKAAETGIAGLPEDRRTDPTLQLALGKAQLKASQPALGAVTIASLLAASDDPLTLNDAAYALADASQDLSKADTAERKALGILDAKSQSWTLDEAAKPLLQASSLLVASWDSMGWILFREGKSAEALPYLRAAWANAPRPVIGEHLGDALVANGDPDSAARTYMLSLDMLHHDPSDALQKHALEAKLDRLKATGTKPDLGGQNTKHLHPYPLGRSGEGNFVSEYRLLLSPAGVLRADPTGQTHPKDGFAIIKALNTAQLFPPNSGARLVKLAVLHCGTGNCDLILEP